MFRLIHLLAGIAFGFTAISQTTQPDRLLWYRGKILKPNTLLTQPGDTIVYNPQVRQVKLLSKSGTGKSFDQMLAETNQTSKRMTDTRKQLQQTIPVSMQADMTAALAKAFKSVEKKWKPLLEKTISLPNEDLALPAQPAAGKGGSGDWTADENPYKEIMLEFHEYMIKHKEDDLSAFLPVPPRYNFSYCFPCDTSANQRYEQDEERFILEMYGIDTMMVNKAMKLCVYIQKRYMDQQANEANDAGFEIMNFARQRAARRAVILMEKYGNDPYRLPAVLRFILRLDREIQILGISNEYPLEKLNYMQTYMETMYRFVMDAIDQKDFSISLNIYAILKFERERQILGAVKNEKRSLLFETLRVNQFKLNTNITAKLGKPGEYIHGHLRGDNWFHAIPDKATCRLNWTLAGPPNSKPAYNLLAGELIGAPVYYIGTKKWQSETPRIKIDFCLKEGETPADSLIAPTFHPEGFREQWQYPSPMGVQEVEQITGALMSSFLDVERIKEEAAKLNEEKIAQLKKEMQDKYSKLAAAGGNMHTIAQQSQADMEKLNREIKALVASTNPLHYIFTPQVSNRNKTIFAEKLNGQELFPENSAIQYAWFHLTMEHDPDGPHPLKLY